MASVFATIIGLLLLTGGTGFVFMLNKVEVTLNSIREPLLMIFFVFCLIWAMGSLLIVTIRSIIPSWRGHKYETALRQGFLLAMLIALHAILQTFFLWNVFSATILTLVVVLIEYTIERLQV